jgi:hypothetical protein
VGRYSVEVEETHGKEHEPMMGEMIEAVVRTESEPGFRGVFSVPTPAPALVRMDLHERVGFPRKGELYRRQSDAKTVPAVYLAPVKIDLWDDLKCAMCGERSARLYAKSAAGSGVCIRCY